MSVEIWSGAPLHSKDPSPSGNMKAQVQDIFNKVVNPAKTHRPLQFHLLHDLESIWWVALWTTSKCVTTASVDQMDRRQLQELQDLANLMFPPGPDIGQLGFFMSEDHFLEVICILPEQRELLGYIGVLCKHLHHWFHNRQTSNKWHETLGEILKRCCLVVEQEGQVIPLHEAEECIRERNNI